MKLLILFTTILLSVTNGCSSDKGAKDISYSEFTKVNVQQKDSLLFNIQDKIDTEFEKAFVNRNTEKLDQIISELEQIDNPISKYWQAYAKYNKGIYYIANKNKEESERFIDESIEILENTSKSSESYALLGTLLNFSIQFKSPMKAGLIGDKAKENFNKAIELEPKNLRAHLGLASLDYYTPEKYGGKKNTVKHITRALEQPDQPLKNPMLPSWGRNTAYQIIIKYYIEKGDKEKAKEYYKTAIEKFPNDYQLNSLSKKLT
jgi:tetratricopeptide (TPR) repeat protein